uniref:Uncharacterized protein n=1 Tax=Arundo donax TaxID=35708 RepID=A0A0A9TL57_ARUDO
MPSVCNLRDSISSCISKLGGGGNLMSCLGDVLENKLLLGMKVLTCIDCCCWR